MILYACVASGPTILHEHDRDPANPLGHLAAKCIPAAPPLHAIFTHTARTRIYAFLIDNQHQDQDRGHDPLRDQEHPLVFFAMAEEALGQAGALLFLRRARDAYRAGKTNMFSLKSLVDEAWKQKEREEAAQAPSPPASSSPRAREMEIAVLDCERDEAGRRKRAIAAAADKEWRQYVRLVVLVDVAVLSVLFGIWVTVCRGFECIRS